ncbi:MFS transporter [Penicillium angulare]|uniref:MFS transporter n=1 Tax=Penicillium angulare TaxID=116970 RepID=UPI00254079FC|nr:MFS transporter [Penicillium angulare]KAJ5266575.1 MFS transporter [Penicillium angulare]
MALALRRAGHLKPEIRLAQAVSEFEAKLSREEKARFNIRKSQSLASPPTIQDQKLTGTTVVDV